MFYKHAGYDITRTLQEQLSTHKKQRISHQMDQLTFRDSHLNITCTLVIYPSLASILIMHLEMLNKQAWISIVAPVNVVWLWETRRIVQPM